MKPAQALKDLFCKQQSKSLKEAIEEILTQYLIDYQLDEQQSELAAEIRQYIDYVRQAPLGTLVTGSAIKMKLPVELIEFFEVVSLRELNQCRSLPCKLLDNVNYRLLEHNHSAKVVFEQACRLEVALQQDDLPTHHASLIQDKLILLTKTLYSKLAELILKAKNAKSLQAVFTATFDEKLCLSLEEVDFAFKTLAEQILFMSNTGFLDRFYSYKTLVDKSNYVDEYTNYIEQLKKKPCNLAGTLDCLIQQIKLAAYNPCRKKQQQLIDDPRMKVRDVVYHTDIWTESAWNKYEGSELMEELHSFLDYDQRVLTDWETISNEHRPATPRPGFQNQQDRDNWEATQSLQDPASLPAFEVLCFKYGLNNPGIDPATLLEDDPSPEIERPSTPGLADATTEIEAIELYNQMASLHLEDEPPIEKRRTLSF